MAGFGAAALPLMASIALLAGAIMLVLGFATPSWAHDGTHYVGLWRYGKCVNPGHMDCYQYDQPSLRHIKSWMHVARAVECAAVFFVSLPLVTMPIYMYIALGMYYKCMMTTMCIFAFLSSVLGFIGAGIFAYNLGDNDWDVAWGIIVTIVGCAIILVGFLVLLVAACAKRPSSLKDTSDFYPATVYVDPDKNQLYTIQVEDD